MKITFDWAGVLSGTPLQWILFGLVTTVALTIAGSILATIIALLTLGLRIGPPGLGRWIASAFIQVFRNTPLLVQLLFWYFAGFGLLPLSWRQWINTPHPWAVLPGGISLITSEFLAATWGMGLFFGVFLAEELRAGMQSIPPGQREAALTQGFGHWGCLRYILLPQALANSWQPLVGQYLNLMKLTSLASGIGLAELTYQVQQIQSYNAHNFEAFAVGTLIYLLLGLILGWVLLWFGPAAPGARKSAVIGKAFVGLTPASGPKTI